MISNGLIRCTSHWNFQETLSRLGAAIDAHHLALVAQVDHAAAAHSAGLELRDTTLLIFGNPRGGTPLMVANQEAGIDLPLKILVWSDSNGQVWVTYNDPTWIAQRHALAATVEPAVANLSRVLIEIVKTVAEATDHPGAAS